MGQNQLPFIIILLGITFYSALAISCQVYPSEYAYRDNSVTRTESASANCRRYPEDLLQGETIFTNEYTHCDGTQLKLANTNLGQEEYQATDHYLWTTGNAEQLLFILPIRVSLTTITLHYYNDNVRGRPRLRFYAVPDDFDVWDAPTAGTPYAGVASVPQGGDLAGRRNVTINVNFNTKKVLMYKYSSSFQLAVSEVEFLHRCEIIPTDTTPDPESTMAESPLASTSVSTTVSILINNTGPLKNALTKAISTTSSFTTDTIDKSNSSIEIIAIVVSLGILSIILIITVVALIWSYKRRSAKHKFNIDDTYSTLNRGSRQTQQQIAQQDSTELYNQIHLSPSTGQTELIPKPQIENTNNPPYNSHPTYPDTENSVTNASAASQTNSPTATYAAIDKNNKKKAKKDDTKHTAAEKHTLKVSSKGVHADNSTKRSQKSLDTYAPDQQDQERVNNEQESNPPYSMEELYTAVKKKPKGSSAPVPQMAEDLYTAVMKKPKENSANDEMVPPIPPHTVEELYTAVHKKPVGNAMVQEDKEEAPPIPPLTVEDAF